MAKYLSIVNLLKNRILHGDYALKDLPAERQLAVEVGVSYMTARRALKELEALGLVVRMANGRLQVNSNLPEAHLPASLAFLIPTAVSPDIERWQRVIVQAASLTGARVRPVLYTHWDDTLLLDTLEGFRGVFFIPIAGTVPGNILDRLTRVERLISVDEDLSQYGIPSIRLFPPVAVQRLLDHLELLGHQRIACLNTQPKASTTEQRIEQWLLWMAAHGFSGTLIDEPVEPFGDPRERAYQVVQRLLAGGTLDDTAVLGITAPAAVGAMRALHEAGRQPGVDVAVAAINGEGYAAYQIPSLTALEAPDAYPYLATCLDWMTSPTDINWAGPLLLQPAEVPLVVRESTMPLPTHV